MNNNILLCPPNGTRLIKLNVRLWDSKTEIKFNGLFETICHKTGVSVVIPSYKGEKTILKCLKSMQAQTLDREKFEIIIALNGERDSTRNKIEQYIKKNSALKIKILELDIAGASYARNMAIQEAIFSHVTFVDDDDYIDQNYLLRLFEKARYNNIVLTGVKDVVDETGEIKNSAITEQMARASKKAEIAYNDVTSVLTMNACKIAPSHFIKGILYNENLKSGEDVVYWTKLLSRFCPAIDFSAGFEDVVYYRVITDNSVSRQKESYDFNVSQRLDVIKDLIDILDDSNENMLFIQSKINAQAGFIKRYLIKNHNDFGRFQKEILAKGIVNHFVQDVNALFTERLVISYCFAPYADTSAIVMSKRINQMDNPVDVISNSMSNVRTKDISLNKIASFNIGKHTELNAPQAFANWNAIAKFSEMVVREIGNIISQRSMYKEIYSRAMWPASHFAAALVKQKYPQIKWIAEFSDPLLMDVTAKERYEKLSLEWLYSHGFIKSIDDNGMNDNTFYWCEYLAYEYADSIIFTNENQRDYMLSYADETLQNKILEKSKIIPQPTLLTSYYDVSKIVLEKDTGITYMAYFGSFYVNRGFDALFQAWKDLDNSQRKKLRLYVYTQQERDQVIEGAPEELKELIIVLPYVGYFDFLALTKQFDILVVMDAQTKGLKLNNPYLPSKISDYLGSGSKILALVEKNSPMSRMQVAGLKVCELQNTTDIQNIIIHNM
nr:glycosyltransferase [Wohlfahrtiimonas chitiniclastica]